MPCPFCGEYPKVREGCDPPQFIEIYCASCGIVMTVWKREAGCLNEPTSTNPKRFIRQLWNRCKKKPWRTEKRRIYYLVESRKGR